MPRIQLYLPDELHRQVKELGLPASELLQEAVRAEVRRRALLEATDRYLAELIEEVDEPTSEERGRAEAISRRIEQRARHPQAG
jgi:post-segregation antitoxin (ccd killing protein)